MLFVVYYLCRMNREVIVMGKTSSAVKDRYNAKAYDSFMVRVPKGYKATIQAHAQAQGESVNAFVGRAMSETMERDKAAPTADEEQ